jgi:hypothetical protein
MQSQKRTVRLINQSSLQNALSPTPHLSNKLSRCRCRKQNTSKHLSNCIACLHIQPPHRKFWRTSLRLASLVYPTNASFRCFYFHSLSHLHSSLVSYSISLYIYMYNRSFYSRVPAPAFIPLQKQFFLVEGMSCVVTGHNNNRRP